MWFTSYTGIILVSTPPHSGSTETVRVQVTKSLQLLFLFMMKGSHTEKLEASPPLGRGFERAVQSKTGAWKLGHPLKKLA
jgi:hypothetical protein